MVVSNPFKPTAGKTPPMLIGRDEAVNNFIEAIDNGPGAPGRLARVSGMRGMGKTVLLNEFGRIAEDRGWLVVEETATPGYCARILEELTPRTRVKGFRAEPSVLGVSLGGIEVERASLSLRDAMGHALESRRGGLLITLDEVQDASIEETRALAVAIQHMIRDDAEIAFVFAGLPVMVDEVINGESLTFLRRAEPICLGFIGLVEVAKSFEETIAESGIRIDAEQAGELAAATHGHPFMVQLVGYHTWQSAYRRDGVAASVTAADIEYGIAEARERFDAIVIEPVIRHLSVAARQYLDAMSRDGDGPSSTSDIAARLAKSTTSLSSVRAKLIDAGVIEPAGRGLVRFTIPFMAAYFAACREGGVDE